jgi:ankyrin repeat protein
MRAAQRGDAALVRLLLDAGADAQRSDRDGLRAADLAREAGHMVLLPLLENKVPR